MEEPHPSTRQAAPPTFRRWPYIVCIVVLFLIAAVLGAGFAYSHYAAQEWRSSANQLTRDLATMTKQRDGLVSETEDLRNSLSDAQNQLASMTTKYNTATDRIRSLSDEKAQVGDEAASLVTLVVMSQKVGQEMDTCISDLQDLQTYLVDHTSYEPASLISYVREVNTNCNQARADSDALTAALAE